MSHHARQTLAVWLLVIAAGGRTWSQDARSLDAGACGLYQSLKGLQSTASVLHVVAHPDDEDGPLLAYFARGQGVRTMLFSITRGEGGANLISAHFFDELGALRTLEHATAAGFYGNELYYSRAADYGFSKTLAEAERQWNAGEPILADLAEVVRRERPTIIASRFRGDPRDGHGHHQLAGVLSQKVFDAAADARRFPEQLADGLHPWQVAKLYTDNILPQFRPEDRKAWTIEIPTGDYDPLLGLSYAQLARFGLGFQRSQGISGHVGSAGPRPSYYRLARAADASYKPEREASVFEGLDTSLTGIAKQAGAEPPAELATGLRAVQDSVQAAMDAFDPRDLSPTAEPLSRGLSQTRELLQRLSGWKLSDETRYSIQHLLQRKETEFQKALAQSAGLSIEAWAARDQQTLRVPFFGESESGFNHALPGQEFMTSIRIVNRSRTRVDVVTAAIEVPPSWQVEQPAVAAASPLGSNQAFEATSRVQVPITAEATRPHWRRGSIREPLYKIDPPGTQAPLPVPPIQMVADLKIAGAAVRVRQTVEVRVSHPEFGAVRYPLTVSPALSVRIPLSHGVVRLGQDKYDVEVVVRSAEHGPRDGVLRLQVPDGWSTEPATHPMQFDKEDDEARFRFQVRLPPSLAAREYELSAVAESQGRVFTEGYQTVTARDVGRTNMYRPATHRVQAVDFKLSGAPRVGYIMGSGDDVPLSLAMLGIRVELLDAADLATRPLVDWDLILVGVRAYAVRPDVRKYNARLLDYVKAGGTLIVQYQTPEFDENFGPYPYEMGRNPEEVSEEDAPVILLQPDHPLFNVPNRIVTADFDGWLEQRGSKFWKTWDARYTPLLACHDAGQDPQEGGMLIARHGQGTYVYSAYAWYRQLPNGVPGAYRLFANLLSLPETMADAPSDP